MEAYGVISFPKRRRLWMILQLGLSLLLLSTFALAQEDKDAMVQNPEWKKYRLSPHKFSVALPKLPIANDYQNDCAAYSHHIYASYADDTVFTVSVYADTKRKPPSWCPEKGKFDVAFMEARIRELEDSMGLKVTGDEKKGSFRKVLLSNDENQFQVVGDPGNGGFFVFWVAHRKDRIVDTSRFFNSLDSELTDDVEDIKNGAPRTIGDIQPNSLDKSFWNGVDPETLDLSFRIVHKQKAQYTTAARTKKTQGIVLLKVALLASGGIGEITTESGLPNGLAKQAIESARRIVFLPKKVKGVNESVTVTVEYSFRIF